MKNILIVLIIISYTSSYCQVTVTERVTVLDPNHHYTLTNSLFDAIIPSPMTYYPSQVSTNGAAFEVVYHNSDGGSSVDGYPSGKVGAYKKGGTYYPGIFAACGMPEQIQNIDNDFRIKWNPYQLDVAGPNDHWWASINVIFDIGDQNDEPIAADRDYDLVIEFDRYDEYEFVDKPKQTEPGEGGSYNYLCRDGFVDDGFGNNIAPLHPFDIVLEGITYQFAVRYKFFNYPAGSPQNKLDKNNKVHIKFIALDNTDVMPFLDHPLKTFIDVTKTYYSLYIDGLPQEEEDLADQKVGIETLWVKSIAAGYEVYKDAGNNNGGDPNNGITLGQYFFLTTTDNNAPTVVTNLNISGSQTTPILTWDTSTDAESINTSIGMYRVYRSVNGASYVLLSDKIYQESFTDNTTQSGSEYSYYVTAVDRSLNEANQSNIVSTNALSIANTDLKIVKVYPNPAHDILHIDGATSAIDKMKLFDILGKIVSVPVNKSDNIMDISNLKSGIYFLKIKQQSIKIIKL